MADFRIRLNTEIDDSKARQQLNDLVNDYKDKPIKFELDADTQKLKDILSELRKIKAEAEDISIGGKSSGTSKMSNDLAEYKRLVNQYNQLQKQLAKETNVKSVELLNNQLKKVGESIDNVKSKLSKVELSKALEFDQQATQKLEASLSKTFSAIETKATSLGQKIESAFNNPNIDMGALDRLREKYESIQNSIKSFDLSKLSGSELNKFTAELEQVTSELKGLENVANQIKLENKFDIDCSKAINELSRLREEYEQLGKNTSGIDGMIDNIKQLQSAVDSVELGTLRNELSQIDNAASQMKGSLGTVKGAVSSTFSDFASSVSQFTIGNILGDVVTSGIYSLKDEILSLDAAMTDIIKVANETDVNSAEKLKSITDTNIQIAKDVAGSVSGVTSSVAEAIKLGFSDMGTAQEIAKFAQVFANVGDMDVGTATKGIATMLNAFQIDPMEKFKVSVNGVTKETTGLEKAMDVLNHTANTQAIDVAGLTSAFQAGGSVLSTYGISLEESTALITAANNSIQDPTRVGNGLKSIAMNMAGVITSAKDGTIETNKTAKSLKEIAGIDIYSDKKTGQIKSMTELLGELQGKWKDLSEEEQLALSNAVAGKTQASVFQSLMQNYETYEELMSQFGKNDHIGSAMQENEKYIDSVAGKLAQLKATWTGIASTVFQSDTIKGFLEGFNSVSEVIGNVISKIDEMGLGLPATIGAFATFGKLFSSIKEAGSITGGISSFIKGIGSFLGQASEIKSVSDYFSLISKNAKGAGSSVVGVADDIAEMAVETATATTGSVGLGTALKGLAKIALPIAGVVALGYAIKKGTDYIEEQRTASTKHYNELGKEVSEYKKSISEIDAESGSLDRIYDRYKELSGITNKTKEQQEEYNGLLNELAKINPDLVLFDDAGNAIGVRIGELQDYRMEIERTKMELENLLNAGLEDRMKLGYDSYQDGLTDYQSQISELAKFREEFLTGRNGLPKDGGDLVGSVIAGYEGADKNADEYFSKLNEFKKKEQEFIDQVVADRKQVSQSSSEWLESIFGQNDKLENAGKKRQQAMDSILNLDYSQFNGDQMEKLGNKLNDWLGSASYADVGAFDNYIAKVNDLNKAWENGEITSKTYKNSVNDIAKTLSELTGGKISTEEWAKLLKLPEFDVESAYKTFSDLEEAQQTLQEKVNEMAQMESQDGRIKMAYDILQDERVPKKIKDSVREMAEDGNISDQEMEVLLELIGKLEESDLENTINEELDALSDQEEITKEVAVEFAVKVKDGVDFDQYLREIITPEEGGIALVIDIQTDMNSGNLESLKNDLAQLPEEKQIGIMVAAASSGEYTPQELHSFLSVLPEEVRTQVIAAIEQSGSMTPEELDQLINGTPDNTDKTVNFKENGGQTVLDILNQIRENTGDKDQTITSKDNGGSGLLTTLKQIKNNTKNGNQTVTSKDSGGSGLLATLKGIVQNTKNKSQTVSSKDSGGSGLLTTLRQIKNNTKNGSQTITSKDNGGSGVLSTLRSIAGSVKNRTQTITTVFKTIGSAVKKAFGPSSTTEFTNVSDTPTDVSASGIEANNVSDTPTESKSTNEGSSSGTFSAKAVDTITTDTTRATNIDTSYNGVWNSIKYGIELFQELDNRISVVNNNLSLLETKLKNSIGADRIKQLKEQNKLYAEQVKLQETLYNSLNTARIHAGRIAEDVGFKLDSQGNFTNYEEKMAQLEANAKRASDAVSNYKGDSESYKNSLSKEAERQSEILDKAKKSTAEYINLQYKEIPNAQKEWQSLQNAIAETNAEIKKLEFEEKIEKFTDSVDQCAFKVAKLESEIDILDVKLKRADGTEKVRLLSQQIVLWDKLKNEQKKSLDDMQKMIAQYEKELSKYGFKFNMGEMVDGHTKLSQLEDELDSYEFKNVEELVKNWEKLYTDTMPNAIETVEKYENSIKDAYEEQLDITKDVEKQITKMYEKQLEDRIDALKKETSAIVDELEKQRKAYKDMRDEVDYQNEYNEKVEEIAKLNKQLETARKDNSLSNRKKIADLEKQLSEAQEELSEIVQNRIDSDIDTMFDDKIEQLEENQDTLIEQLESMWSDEKIASMVAQSLKTGLFSGLDGQVTDLENALVSFGESTGEMFGVTGAIIKEEWLGNLEVALATVKDINNIMNQLEIPDFSSVNYSSTGRPSVTTGNINVTVNAQTNASAEDIANQVEKAVNDALKNATEGL